MNAVVGHVFFDTCTLANFAVVNRLDLLESSFGYRARWTETVQAEIRRGVPVEPALRAVLAAAWLGTPVEVGGDLDALQKIDNIRRGLGGGMSEPLKHLGEAEIIYYLESVEPGGIFVTDDRPALDFANRRGLFVLDTSRVLAECFAQGEIGCPAAFDLVRQMSQRDRGVRLPSSHMEICPS